MEAMCDTLWNSSEAKLARTLTFTLLENEIRTKIWNINKLHENLNLEITEIMEIRCPIRKAL